MKIYAKKFVIVFLFIILSGGNSLYAATVTGQAPQGINTGNALADAFIDGQLNTIFEQLRTSVEAEVNTKWQGQTELAKGFSNATAFAANAAPFDGYHGYDLFGIIWGVQLSAQFPSSLNSLDQDAIEKDMKQDGDIYAGIGVGSALNIGLNMGFLKKGLYMNAKFWKYSRTLTDTDDMKTEAKTTTFGIGVNYQFLRVRSLIGLLTWRGLSFGTGFNYNNNKIDMTLNNVEGLNNSAQPVSYSGTTYGNMTVTPKLTMGYNAKAYVIPLEIHTAAKLLILNVNLGAGADLIFGGTDITIKNINTVDVVNDTGVSLVSTPGYVNIDASTPKTAPSHFRTKLMAGAGVTILGVHVNTNIVYYINDAASFGLSVGFVW